MFPVVTVFEITCFFCALFFLKNTSRKEWKAVKWFMLFTVIMEIAQAITGRVFHLHNSWLVNIYTSVNFIIISWLITRFTPFSKLNKPVYLFSLAFFIISFFVEILLRGFFSYCNISNIISDVLLFILCNRFFYLLLKQDEWIDIYKHAGFWFITGLFLFNFCATIADLFDEQLSILYVMPNVSLYYFLYLVLNLVLYGCWSFSFVCKYQETI